MKAIQQTTNWNYFCSNYPNNWIEDSFSTRGDKFINHLKNKFNHYHDKYGSHGAVRQFFMNLSPNNQETLLEWVNNNYAHCKYIKKHETLDVNEADINVLTDWVNDMVIDYIDEEPGEQFLLLQAKLRVLYNNIKQ